VNSGETVLSIQWALLCGSGVGAPLGTSARLVEGYCS
jgi:hypothetical protein